MEHETVGNIDTTTVARDTTAGEGSIGKSIEKYLDLTDKINAMNRTMKELKKSKNDLEEHILRTMRESQVSVINVSGKGSIKLSCKKSKTGISERSVCEVIEQAVPRESDAALLIQKIKKLITVKEKECLDFKKN